VRCGGASGSAVLVRRSCAAEAPDVNRKGKQPPNMRLKLSGARAGRIALPRRPAFFLPLQRLAPPGIAPAA